MQEMKEPNFLGIAYHSPLDVDALIPEKYTRTLDPGDAQANILYSRGKTCASPIPIQFIFAPAAELSSRNIKIVDELGGKPIKLSSKNLDRVLRKVIDG